MTKACHRSGSSPGQVARDGNGGKGIGGGYDNVRSGYLPVPLNPSYGRRVDQRLVSFLNALRPAELALRDWVRPVLTAEILQAISELDYGEEIEENRQAIKELLMVKHLPAQVWWPPREVLELCSYGNPDDRQGHAARLFACLVIVRADDAIQPASTLAALVESAVALGPDATEDAVRFLAWCRLHEPGSWRDDIAALPFLTLGLLLTYLLSPLRTDPEIVAGLTRIAVEEVQAALAEENPWWPNQPPAEVLKKMAGGDGFRTWRALVERCAKVEGIEPLRDWFRTA
jgi:hypothetical protein